MKMNLMFLKTHVCLYVFKIKIRQIRLFLQIIWILKERKNF
jgi:hypothetical protein